ncbi:MAG: glycosyltransferase family 2 protein [Methylococcales bacterium]
MSSGPSQGPAAPKKVSGGLTGPCFAVVIPAYNEAATIGALLDGVLERIQTVIVVNDASTDQTAAIAASRPVIVLNQPQNSGKGHALSTGFRHAIDRGADFVITMDGDSQHDPADLPKFIDAACRFPEDLIAAARILNRNQAPRARLLANRCADFWISWASGQPLSDSQCGYRCVPSALLKQIRVPDTPARGFVFESEFLIEASRLGRRITFVPIRSCYPPGRRPSYFRPVTDIARITRMVAWKLLSRGLYIKGLATSLRSEPHLLQG